MTQSLEDYLEMISFLSDEGPVRITGIADRMKVSKPSALSAVRVLSARGFIDHERYGLVNLTPRGRVAAEEIRERHNMLIAFLENVVGVSPETSEIDACKMEHILSPETLDKMRILTRETTREEL